MTTQFFHVEPFERAEPSWAGCSSSKTDEGEVNLDAMGAYDHPWLGRLVPLKTLLLNPSSRFHAPDFEQPREPLWHGMLSGLPAERSIIDQFFRLPLTAARPALALWWGADGESSWNWRKTTVMAVTDARVLTWMGQKSGGKALTLKPDPLFVVNTHTQDWRSMKIPMTESPTSSQWSDRVGVWCCREDQRITWGMGGLRCSWDLGARSVASMVWSGARGWKLAPDAISAAWPDLMGLQKLSHQDQRNGDYNINVHLACLAQALPNVHQWSDRTPYDWISMVEHPSGNTAANPLTFPLCPPRDAGDWQTMLLEHAQDWRAKTLELQHHLRALVRSVRRINEPFSQWAKWAWSNSGNPWDVCTHRLSEGLIHHAAWATLLREAPHAGHWAKLAMPFALEPWTDGNLLSASTLSSVWPTPAGQRWARRQSAATVHRWLRLHWRLENQSADVPLLLGAWGELFARWDVPHWPTWAMKALDNDRLRGVVVPVLLEEFALAKSTTWEQNLLCEALRRVPEVQAAPLGARHMLRAWIKDVQQLPWAGRQGMGDPLGLQAWGRAFDRMIVQPPPGHERWTWGRWERWHHNHEAWALWFQDHGVAPGGVELEVDGWRVLNLVADDEPIDLKVPEPAVSLEDMADAVFDTPVDGVTTLLWWDEWKVPARWERWHVEHTNLGAAMIVLRQTNRGWRPDTDQTPTALLNLAEKWVALREAVGRLGASFNPAMDVDSPSSAHAGASPMIDMLNQSHRPAPLTEQPLALGSMQFQGWRLVPVGTSRDLNRLARVMSNCVGDGMYEDPIENGTCRLFIATGPKLKRALLLDLRYSLNFRSWELAQAEGWDNDHATHEERVMGYTLATLYTLLCPNGHPPCPTGMTTSPIRLPVDSFDADHRPSNEPARMPLSDMDEGYDIVLREMREIIAEIDSDLYGLP